MRTKEEILQSEAIKKYGKTIVKGFEGFEITYVAFDSRDGVIQNSMDEYAKEVAIDFVVWVCGHKISGYEILTQAKRYWLCDTTEQLFEQFKKQQP